MYIFLIIAFLCYVVAGALVAWRLRQIKSGEVKLIEVDGPTLSDVFSHMIDNLAMYLVLFVREGVHYGYVYLLSAGRKLASFVKILTIKVERKFSQIIRSAHERKRRGDGERGSTSLFLQELKLHHDKIKS